MSLAPAQKAVAQKSIVRSLEGEVTPNVPFWFMRQAGRYLPEYRDLRATAGSFLDLCYTPAFATEVTLQPVRRFGMDAAILFSDILVIPHALGQGLDFITGEGPRLPPLQSADDVRRLDVENIHARLAPVYETIRNVRTALDADKSLIGFAGAPWTVACYMLQGYGDGAFETARLFALREEKTFALLMEKLTEATAQYLLRQIENGVDVVQIFDSWAGLLPEGMFEQWVIAPTAEIVKRIHAAYPGFPVIGFPRGAGSMYPVYAARTGVNGVGLDTQVSLAWAAREMGRDVCLQGNLDPALLLTGGQRMEDEVLRILDLMKGTPFIFNLGHGVIKETPPEHVAQLAAIIKEFKR